MKVYVNFFILFLLIIISCSKPEYINLFDPMYELQSPTNFNAAPVSQNQIKLTWNKSSEILSAYIVEKHTQGDTIYYFLIELDKNKDFYYDNNIILDTEYSYKLIGRTGDNFSAAIEVSVNTASFIEVISPDGDEEWLTSDNKNIVWYSQFVGDSVRIELYQNDYYYDTINDCTSNQGSYFWEISEIYDESDFYRIKITDVNNSIFHDFSDDFFSIHIPPSITIISPNGGENWYLDSSYYISWLSVNVTNYVKIELYENDNYFQTIYTSTYNDGSYYWNIPATYNESDYFKIKISDTNNSLIYDLSDDYFSIYSSYVTIGNGTNTWNYPFHTDYDDARTQIIYLSSEINRSGSIYKIAFDINTIPGQDMYNFVVRMKHTSLSYYSSSNFDNYDYVVCLNTTKNIYSEGWVEISLSTPFYYNNSDNLILDVSFDNEYDSSYGYCRYTPKSNYRSIYKHSNSYDGDPLFWNSGSRSSKLPNIRLYFDE